MSPQAYSGRIHGSNKSKMSSVRWAEFRHETKRSFITVSLLEPLKSDCRVQPCCRLLGQTAQSTVVTCTWPCAYVLVIPNASGGSAVACGLKPMLHVRPLARFQRRALKACTPLGNGPGMWRGTCAKLTDAQPRISALPFPPGLLNPRCLRDDCSIFFCYSYWLDRGSNRFERLPDMANTLHCDP